VSKVRKLNIVRGILFVIIGTMMFVATHNIAVTFGQLCWVYLFGVLSTLLQTAEQSDLEDAK